MSYVNGMAKCSVVSDGIIVFHICFSVGSGVRQGSCLSPVIFNVYMNAFIEKLKSVGIGCHIYGRPME